jgi:hypothetical protein
MVSTLSAIRPVPMQTGRYGMVPTPLDPIAKPRSYSAAGRELRLPCSLASTRTTILGACASFSILTRGAPEFVQQPVNPM